jgi:predicted lipoprotein with Yx(FWY)xxD motif
MRIRPIALLAAIAIAALVAGCGSDSGSGTTKASASSGGYGAAAAPKPASTSSAGTVKTTSGDLGTFLVDGAGRTLYLWQADKAAASTCTGACAQAWPPLTTTGAPKASGDVTATWLGTTKRPDGTLQVTYKDHPLYRFAGDRSAGDTNGQGSDGFGAPWYVLGADGNAVTGT